MIRARTQFVQPIVVDRVNRMDLEKSFANHYAHVVNLQLSESAESAPENKLLRIAEIRVPLQCGQEWISHSLTRLQYRNILLGLPSSSHHQVHGSVLAK